VTEIRGFALRAGDLYLDDLRLGPAGDDAFTFVEKEDGDSASHWAVFYPYPSGATVSSVTDTTRHPLRDGQATGKVIQCLGGSGNIFGVGDNDAGSYNPNDVAWNATDRVLSFWYKGGFGPLTVGVTTASGAKELRYWASSGTNSVDGGGNVNIYLGTSAATTTWARFERNIEADWEGVATGVAWQNTDGVAVKPTSTLSYDFWFDDVRLGNAMTVEHNTLGWGGIAHILRHTEFDTSTGVRTDRWFHYDQVGSVLSESDATGALAQRHDQEAFGNTLASWQTGLIGGDRPGWHHNTKEWDGDVGLVYMYQRWYSAQFSSFLACAPYPAFLEHGYAFALQRPTVSKDPSGESPYLQCIRDCLAALNIDKTIMDNEEYLKAISLCATLCRKVLPPGSRQPKFNRYCYPEFKRPIYVFRPRDMNPKSNPLIIPPAVLLGGAGLVYLGAGAGTACLAPALAM